MIKNKNPQFKARKIESDITVSIRGAQFFGVCNQACGYKKALLVEKL